MNTRARFETLLFLKCSVVLLFSQFAKSRNGMCVFGLIFQQYIPFNLNDVLELTKRCHQGIVRDDHYSASRAFSSLAIINLYTRILNTAFPLFPVHLTLLLSHAFLKFVDTVF